MNLMTLVRRWNPMDIVERLTAIPPLLGERAGVRADVASSRRAIYFPSPSFGSWAQCAKNVQGVLSPRERAGPRRKRSDGQRHHSVGDH